MNMALASRLLKNNSYFKHFQKGSCNMQHTCDSETITWTADHCVVVVDVDGMVKG